MLNLATTIKGDKKLAQKFDKASKTMPKALERGMWKCVYMVQRTAKRKLTGGSPLNVRSGTLRSSLAAEVKKVHGNAYEGKVGTNIIYAKIHEYGATIRAKTGEYMRFPGAGGWVTTSEVKIPARPWLNPSLEENRKKINKTLGMEVKDHLKKHRL